MMFKCRRCGIEKPPAEYRKEPRVIRGHASTCRCCENKTGVSFARMARAHSPMEVAAKRMLDNARTRAAKRGVPFSLSLADIPTPAVCPALGVVLCYTHTRVQPDSPSLDRIRPELGYVPGNVAVISAQANRIKNDATLTQLRAVVDWLGGLS